RDDTGEPEAPLLAARRAREQVADGERERLVADLVAGDGAALGVVHRRAVPAPGGAARRRGERQRKEDARRERTHEGESLASRAPRETARLAPSLPAAAREWATRGARSR